jgi:hypothetical protein
MSCEVMPQYVVTATKYTNVSTNSLEGDYDLDQWHRHNFVFNLDVQYLNKEEGLLEYSYHCDDKDAVIDKNGDLKRYEI